MFEGYSTAWRREYFWELEVGVDRRESDWGLAREFAFTFLLVNRVWIFFVPHLLPGLQEVAEPQIFSTL